MHNADTHHDHHDRTIFGFWLYLMSDCILFGVLFAVYAVLRNNTFGGPSASEILHLPSALAETLIMLTSSFTAGLALFAAYRKSVKGTISWIILTFLLGAAVLTMAMMDFSQLIHEGNSWQRSGFLSSFFGLLGTHGLHIGGGLVWIAVLIPQLLVYGLTSVTFRRLICFKMFWQFLNIVWIFIYTFVYLMGAR
jgi:cytochrome o ubiquinol oxidase subunit 3